ncbi:MAG: M48 family metallopeptidase [Sphingomonadales bacterium]|nr:M48 family metallopeptidase [Sphingomonadales bacterium]MDE2570354.1 M48 family metallopeptidase [Sphingomonadales bacterium]
MIDWLRRAGLRGRDEPAPAPPRFVAVGDRALPLVVRRLRNARRLTLRLAPDGSEIRVSMPAWCRLSDAEDFAASRAGWIARALAALPASAPVEPGGTLRYRGEHLAIDWHPAHPRRPALHETAIRVGGPSEAIGARLQRWLEKEALRLFAEDIAFYCQRARREPPRLAMSRAQRRWGSCASDGTIRLNWRLVMAPDAVRRSVVAHEVAHLAHFDHSPAFHAALGDLFEGDLRSADRWLKREGRGLYQPFG